MPTLFTKTPRLNASAELKKVMDALLYEPREYTEQVDLDREEAILTQAHTQLPDNAKLMACLAICMAAGRRKFVTAEKLAIRAMRASEYDPWGCYAIGRINLMGSRRFKAFQFFERTRRLAGKERKLKRVINALDKRRPPVVTQLPRDHPLNITLGRFRTWLAQGHNTEFVSAGLVVIFAWIIYLIIT